MKDKNIIEYQTLTAATIKQETKKYYEQLSSVSESEREDIILEIFKINIPLAKNFAARFINRLTRVNNYEDCLQICLLGLHKAVKTYNNNLKYAFSTYAECVMKNMVNTWLTQNKPFCNNRAKVAREISAQDKTPTENRISKKLGLSTFLAYASLEPLSLESPVSGIENFTFGDTLVADDSIDDIVQCNIIKETIDTLPPPKRDILNMYFFLDMKIKDIAKVYNVSSQCMSKLIQSAKKELQSMFLDEVKE